MSDPVIVRYIVDDLDAALAFYTTHLGFESQLHPNDSFALLTRGGLHLALSAAHRPGSATQPVPDTARPGPGGWNRICLPVTDIDADVDRLRAAGVVFRDDIVGHSCGTQIVLDDPAGNPIELFQPLR